MVRRRVDTFEMYVFENMGLKRERIGKYHPEQAAAMDFSPLNFILLERVSLPRVRARLGMDEGQYFHERDQITKKEVRAAGLAALQVGPRHTVWDLGAGSGSVAIEASLLARNGRVLAVEKRARRVEFIRENIRRTGCYHVEVVPGEMPECLASLPEPDRIFIGGGLGRNNLVLAEAARLLKPGGRLVLHIVLLGSLNRACGYLTGVCWPYSISQIMVSRSKELAGDYRMETLNPVYIVTGCKPKQGNRCHT
ncbi:MAG: precorrin-6Y C5,15-methyltransferase (decarboxylating) subunit CbiT [Deltaproteobacteria bacterium]|nr:MAG: precorrin-6Y C5,15-methyltransferase (decarboxylating) subunit CbiT [Deltaproteobacteria bacterium]